ncbi:GNAT family N-acetyltransferase [Hoeflea ulvae]|uniref:GNAT family N-acetyltransferase n=1 Tax=Hoeflea ulvae TaxID=2983764 RepID=A0ABT3YKJ7_9HYPH|nr:GNAT family protein [Hoeflea ulvae]MCY0096431.1 GNAT family N-acetyltransferase [Hoeflea ulvae]
MRFDIAPNLSLRLLQPDDADLLFEVVDQNRAHLRQWLPWLDRNTTREDSRAFIESIHHQHDAGKGFACGVFRDNRLVGLCGFHEIDTHTRSVVIGYWLAEAHQGNGIISRCAAFFIDYAFTELGLQRVDIPVAEGNMRSRAVCERLGLSDQGTIENAEWLYDKWVNHIRYSIGADQWRDAGDADFGASGRQ